MMPRLATCQKLGCVSKALIAKTSQHTKSRCIGTKKYYAIVGGKNGFTGIVEDWDTCGKLVHRVSNAKYKSFPSKQEAEQFVKNGGDSKWHQPKPTCGTSSSNDQTQDDCQDKQIFQLYIDGACIHNGTENAKAGYGVYFGDEDPRNISRPLLGEIQTNQRAELSAMIAALESLLQEPIIHQPQAQVYIYTDSKYVKDILTAGWLEQWKRNNWKRRMGQVKNLDLIQSLDYLWNKLFQESKAKIQLVWVKGHNGVKGNEEADRLATKGIYQSSSTPNNV